MFHSRSRFYIVFFLGVLFLNLNAQDQNNNVGTFSGGFTANANIFLRDSLIGASNIPQYDNELFGAESWFNLNYTRSGYKFRLRYDMFSNSNLLDPNSSYTEDGIGYWYVNKQLDKLGISVGYIYDQIGSGLIYRSYEERPQLIDNALIGARVDYKIDENWKVKAFAGKQKYLFGTNPSTLKGVSLEGYLKLGSESNVISFAPGIGFVNRTHSVETIDKLKSIVSNYDEEDRPKLSYNMYMVSIYNTMTFSRFNLYTEYAYKAPDTFRDLQSIYIKESGSIFYGSLGYAQKGLGISIEGKRTENFDARTDPTFTRNVGLVNFVPPMNRLNTYRLTSRYSPATQLLSEKAIQLDIRYAPIKKISFYFNYADIQELNGNRLYKEFYFETLYKKKRSWQLTTGIQLQTYNQERYETKPEVPLVETITPFVDFLYKLSRKKSIRIEAQYMLTDEDYGDWAFGLAELGLAPHWQFELSGMYNINPGKNSPTDEDGEGLKLIYPTFGVTYSRHANRYSLRYVKQVEGIVCSGGICRLEPAFSGVRMTVSSTF